MMKKNFFKLILGCMCLGGIMAFVASCDADHCGSAKPYYCSSAKTCCGYKYYDGHGTCWSSMDGCRSSGYACQTCHLED